MGRGIKVYKHRRYFDFGAISLPWAESLNFLPLTVSNIFKFSTQWSDMPLFIDNGTKVKITSKI
jgi:hypothetical protein